jgi:hypothetical protein
MTHLVGTRLGDFEIVRELGRGGMGVVYEARQVSLRRKVALKVLSGPGPTLTAVERFHREAEAAARLHHTNIVPVYATGEQDDLHFYAMELIEGPALDQVLQRLRWARDGSQPTEAAPPAPPGLALTGPYVEGGAPSPAASAPAPRTLDSGGDYFDGVARLLAGVADALDHAHKQGVVHRDIKPANLLLSTEGRLSVNDFGLARLLEEPGLTVTGEFVGTPAYVSPEQVAAGRIAVDHRTDIYSLGATLYELLTLQPPFTGPGREQVLAQVLQRDPRPPRKVNPAVPVDLETICLKCLEKDPARRYQTAGALADDLRRYLNRFAIRARRAGPLTRLGKWVKRNPALAAAAAAVLLAAGAAVFFAWQARDAEQRRLADLTAERRAVALERSVTAALNGQNEEAERHIAAAEGLGASPGEVSKVRGIIALNRNDPAAALTHLRIAGDRLGPSLAVQALLARAYHSLSDSRAERLVAELDQFPARTAEDFLFRGQIVVLFDDPRLGMRDIEQAIRLRASPLARLALAEARIQVALDTGSEEDARAAVRDAELAQGLLPTSDLALARIIHSRGRVRCWDESKRLGQEHLRACLMLKGRMQSARPGRPGASVAWTSRMGQAQSPARGSQGGPAGGETWLRWDHVRSGVQSGEQGWTIRWEVSGEVARRNLLPSRTLSAPKSRRRISPIVRPCPPPLR